MDNIHEITNEIQRRITEGPAIKNRFTKHIDRFCKMVEDYGQALQPYVTKLEKFHKALEEGKFVIPETMKRKRPDGLMESSPVVELCPPPKGWVKISSSDNQFLNIDWPALVFRPVEPVNPLLWFGLFGWAGIQRKPEEDEKLMCEYVRLAIVHDYNLLFHSGTPIDTRIISADYKGKWFQRDEFFKTVWYYHSQLTKSAQSQLTRAFDRIQKEVEVPAGGKAGDNEQKDTLKPIYEKAYQSYQIAIGKTPELADKKDGDVYKWLSENADVLDAYELPSFDTWQRYIREGRKHYGTSKNTPRAGRTGRSIITLQ